MREDQNGSRLSEALSLRILGEMEARMESASTPLRFASIELARRSCDSQHCQ